MNTLRMKTSQMRDYTGSAMRRIADNYKNNTDPEVRKDIGKKLGRGKIALGAALVLAATAAKDATVPPMIFGTIKILGNDTGAQYSTVAWATGAAFSLAAGTAYMIIDGARLAYHAVLANIAARRQK